MDIDGQGRSATSEATFEVTSPATGEIIEQVADGGEADCVAAIDSAHAALPGWAGETVLRRSGILHRAFDRIIERKEQLANTMTREEVR